MSNIRRREVENSYDHHEAWAGDLIVWPRAPRYKIVGGWIDLEPGGGNWRRRFPPPSPFEDDLLLSFARLGAHGEPSTKAIEKWVNEYGLLLRKDEQLSSREHLKDDRVNQKPMQVREFIKEVFRVRDLLALYTQIRDMDYGAVRSRCVEPHSAVDRSLADDVKGVLPETRHKVDDRDVAASFLRAFPSLLLQHNAVIGLADKFLAEELSESLSRVCLRIIPGFALPHGAADGMSWRELEEGGYEHLISLSKAAKTKYTLRQSWHCPDLLSAIYLQLFLLATREAPMRFCEACQTPFQAKPKHKRFCNDTCRSNGRTRK